ncbi:DUF6997 domain-containing protein [Anabaena azotica]|uniref:DUF6997 domain-containing protein n=1 Tax=Anabaena azotica TaxID=197653 RepID=UPI0039A57094
MILCLQFLNNISCLYYLFPERFDTYLNIDYDASLEPTPVDFPSSIESIDYCNLFSESAALSCAFNIDVINDLITNSCKV